MGPLLYGTRTTPKNTVRLLEVTIDAQLTFRENTSLNKTKVLSMLPTLYRLAFSRGASLRMMHHLATTLAIPTLLWGSETWWTGARHILDNLNPTYNKLARLVAYLPRWTRIDLLLCGASLPPLDLLLDHKSRKYALRILCGPDSHPNKRLLTRSLLRPLDKGVGLRRIAHLINEIVPPDSRMERPNDPKEFLAPHQIEIQQATKTEAAAAHNKWAPTHSGILLYTDGSRNRTNSSGWHITANNRTIQEGHCNIGPNADILDAEIHAIREGITWIRTSLPNPKQITICVDNQGALEALRGARAQ